MGTVEVRNFLGEKFIRKVKMHEGVTCENSKEQKDELIITGNAIEAVSQSVALIQQPSKIRISESFWTVFMYPKRVTLLLRKIKLHMETKLSYRIWNNDNMSIR